MIKDIESSAAALYDGGWRVEDRAQLAREHDLTPDEANALCAELERLDDEGGQKVIKDAAQISIDNGASFTTPEEALKAVDMAALAENMNDDAREAVHAELAPCTDLEFLTRYLEIAPEDLIFG